MTESVALSRDSFAKLMKNNYNPDFVEFKETVPVQRQIHLSYRTTLYMEVLKNPEVSDAVKCKIIEHLLPLGSTPKESIDTSLIFKSVK